MANPFASVMSVFRQAPTTTPAADPSATNPTVPGDGTAKPDGTGPVAIPKVGDGAASPLDGFKNLWDTDKDAKPPTSWEPRLAIDPAKILAAAKTVDFSKSIAPELLAKAAGGDATALSQVINEAAQSGFAQAMGSTANLVKAALTDQAAVFRDQILPEVLRKHAINTQLQDDSLFTNPAVAPMLKMVEDQLVAKNPTMSPAQIKEQAKKFTTEFAEHVAASSGKRITDVPSDKTTGRSTGREVDWDKFMAVPTAE